MSTLKIKRENGKIFCPLADSWHIETPEEKVRQEYIKILVEDYGYSLDQMAQEIKVNNSQRGQGKARADIARNMFNSLHSMAQTSDSVEIDVTELMALRQRLLAHKDELGTKITINDLLSYAAVKMLKTHPLANASFSDTEILCYPDVNLSMAVATDYGLTSPVVHGADRMSLVELSLAMRDLVVRARDRKLTADDQQGGTFTLTNMGIFPVDNFNPILPAPQSCIIGFGRCVEKPAVYQGQICIRTMMVLSVTYDHRVFDGGEVGSIMKTMKEYLETPELFLVQ